MDVAPPPLLDLGNNTNDNPARSALLGEYNAIDKSAGMQRKITMQLADLLDNFTRQFKKPDEHFYAKELNHKLVNYLKVHLFSSSNGDTYVPLRLQGRTDSGQPTITTSSSKKPVTFADIAKIPKNQGATKFSHATTTSRGQGSTLARQQSKEIKTERQDRRVFITMELTQLLDRPEPYAIRRAICDRFGSKLAMADIPSVSPIKTGWALLPSSFKVREALLSPEGRELIISALGATGVREPEKWLNYAVPGVPLTLQSLERTLVNVTTALIAEEVFSQTKCEPTNVRISRHGANHVTGTATFIVSFTKTVRSFRLFSSEQSKLIEHKQPITRHDPGCQGYCTPLKCTRAARCVKCSVRVDQHEGGAARAGANCTQPDRCANCFGPFPASHDHCPAKPKRHLGNLIRLTRKEQDKIRKHGAREYKALHTAAPDTAMEEETAQPEPQASGSGANVLPNPSRKRAGATIMEYEQQGCSPTPSAPEVSPAAASSQPAPTTSTIATSDTPGPSSAAQPPSTAPVTTRAGRSTQAPSTYSDKHHASTRQSKPSGVAKAQSRPKKSEKAKIIESAAARISPAVVSSNQYTILRSDTVDHGDDPMEGMTTTPKL